MSSELYLKKLVKMLEISYFFVFQGNLVFEMIEQAELNRAFFARYGEPSRAFLPKSSSQNQANRAELHLGPNTTF